jgi:hypothetical protein
MMLSATHNSYYIGRHNWRDTKEYERMQRKKAPCSSMTFFGTTAILESAHIYLKAGYASCMSNPVFFTFDSVWAAPIYP